MIRVQLQQEMRNAMAMITYDLQQAGPSTDSIIEPPADGNPYPGITFRVCNGVSGGRISWSANTIHYGVSANQLLRTEAGANLVIAQNTQSLSFRRQPTSPDIVEVDLALAQNSRSATLHDALHFEVQLRN